LPQNDFFGANGGSSYVSGLREAVTALGGNGGLGRLAAGPSSNIGWNGGGGSYDYLTGNAGNGGFAGGSAAPSLGIGGGGGGSGSSGSSSGLGGDGQMSSINGIVYGGGGGGGAGAGNYLTGAGNTTFAAFASDSVATMAYKACMAYYGSNCISGSCSYFTYYYYSPHTSCRCDKPVGSYEWVYYNGYGSAATVGVDYGGQSTSVSGDSSFVRQKSSSGCDSNSWTLTLKDFGVAVSFGVGAGVHGGGDGGNYNWSKLGRDGAPNRGGGGGGGLQTSTFSNSGRGSAGFVALSYYHGFTGVPLVCSGRLVFHFASEFPMVFCVCLRSGFVSVQFTWNYRRHRLFL
jgi:hypothetical protein